MTPTPPSPPAPAVSLVSTWHHTVITMLLTIHYAVFYIHISICKYFWSVILLGKNSIPWKKQLFQLAVQSHKCFSSKQSLCFCMQCKHFTCTLFCHIKNNVYPRARFNKNNFTASSRIFLHASGSFLTERMWQRWLLVYLMLLPWFMLRYQQFYYHCVCAMSENGK